MGETRLSICKDGGKRRCVRRTAFRALLAWAVVLAAATSPAAELHLSWNDNSSNEEGFRIERSADGEDFVELATVGANATEFRDATIVEGKTYEYRIRAYNAFGESLYSNSASGMIEAPLVESESVSISFVGLQDVVYELGEEDAFQISVGGAQSSVENVSFSVNEALVGEDETSPYEFIFTADTVGARLLTAVVSTELGVYEGSLLVSVQAPTGQPPSISQIPDIALLQGGAVEPVSFTIGDELLDADDLALWATSSNQALLRDDGIAISGSGEARELTLEFVEGVIGQVEVMVFVDDGTYAASETFVVDVEAATAPTISPVESLSIRTGDDILPIPFQIGDAETAADNLQLSVASSNRELLPSEGIEIVGTGANRELNLSHEAGVLGQTTVTISVSDGSAETVEVFELSVQGPPAILSQPQDTEVIVGDITALNIEVAGYPLPRIQWYLNGEAIEGADEAELLLLQAGADDAGEYTVVALNELGSVTSDVARLTVESLIEVVEVPGEVTITGSGSAVLSVAATGPGLSYQWYRGQSGDKTQPIEGATSNVYETDLLSADDRFWVEISTGGIAQGLESVDSPTIFVNVEPLNRYFFGTVGPGSAGSFGMVVRDDGSAVFLADLDFVSGPLEILDLEVSETGTFAYEQNGFVILSGSIVDGSVSGVFNGSMYSFWGPQADPEGVSAGYSGFYTAVLPNTSDGQALVIAGPDSESFVSVGLKDVARAGMASVDETGTLVVEFSEQDLMAVELNDEVKSLNGSFLLGSDNYAVDGRREDVLATNMLFNTSIRGQVKGGSGTMIAGFVVGGAGTKEVLIRGLGPDLQSRGVSSAISDPRISLFRLGDGALVAQNDDWSSNENAADIEANSQLVGASSLVAGSMDAALLLELPGGVYTAVVENVDNQDGTALVEVFDVSEAKGESTGSSLANISMRGEVSQGDDVTIAGFVVSGDAPKRLLIRAMGDELESMGVEGALADPQLSIYQATGEGPVFIAGNDDWQEESAVATEAAAMAGAFPFDGSSKSSAKVIWLDPGLYTAIAQSADASRGVVLVEVYELE